jgi:hypothetical protein
MGMALFRGYEKVRGGRPFSGERIGGTLFFRQEKENIDIFGHFGHFVSLKVPKYSKIAYNSPLGVVLKCFKLL